jgi:hypothetical protein
VYALPIGGSRAGSDHESTMHAYSYQVTELRRCADFALMHRSVRPSVRTQLLRDRTASGRAGTSKLSAAVLCLPAVAVQPGQGRTDCTRHGARRRPVKRPTASLRRLITLSQASRAASWQRARVDRPQFLTECQDADASERGRPVKRQR